jgi:hypothetical protein
MSITSVAAAAFFAEHAQHVGGARVSAAFFPDVGSHRPADKDGGRYIAQKVGYYDCCDG